MDICRGAIYRAQIAAIVLIGRGEPGRDKSRPYVILTPLCGRPSTGGEFVEPHRRKNLQEINRILWNLCITLHPMLVILREVAGSMRRVDCSDFAMRCNDRRGCTELP